jgi:hypothetical protein
MHFALIFLFHIWTPTISLALTSGPNQPEFTGFSTISTENMVDPFTGDFGYSIPLITIPGFQDGIPLILNYQAGVTMEQEASWVGLGWSLNTGAINRSVRGIPDDFNGDLVTKRMYSKPNKTFSVGLGFSMIREVGGGMDTELKSFSSPGLGFYYNNYTGFGMGMDVLNTGDLLSKSMKTRFTAGLNLSLDSKNGATLKPVLSGGIAGMHASLRMPITSRNGIESISFAGSIDGYGLETPSVTSSFLPSIQFPRTHSSKTYDGKFGLTTKFITADASMSVTMVKDEFKQNVLKLPAYGYLNLENAKSQNALMDFNRENDIAANKRSSVISNPVATNDVYSINAPGFSDQMRVRRSDYGIFRDPVLLSESRDLTLGADVDLFPGEVKAGVNIRANLGGYSSTSAMPIGSLDGAEKFDFNNSAGTKGNGFYQSAVLMSDKEVGVNKIENGSGFVGFDDGNALQVDIENTVASGKKMRLKDQYLDKNGNNGNFGNYTSTRQERFKRNTVYQYVTFEENANNNVVKVETHDVSKQIHTIKALTSAGTLLEFGKPLFNLEKKEVTFSINHEYNGASGEKPHVGKLTSYTTTEASGGNTSGIDHMYSSYELPPYTYAHLLTNMYSADYVDLEGNGPTENDFGQYAHYEYRTPETYKWRAPYADVENQANFNIGSLATKEDDKGSYMYGKKEITYVHTIETKTHIAEFITEKRKDGLPVKNEVGKAPVVGDSYTSQRVLKEIILYAKGENYDTDSNDKKEIKKARLDYDYTLCDGVPNNIDGEGKLTLKKVDFTYYGNDKSSATLSPYIFDYHEGDVRENPVWNANLIDNWGNYQPARFDQTTESLAAMISPYPYPNQSDDISYSKRQNWAGAWNLKEITLPSGGKISVNYEQDDYQYVQNKKAMMMAKIKGFCTDANINSGVLGDVKKHIKKDYLNMILEVPKKLSITQAKAAIKDIDRMYYKAYVRLKQSNGASRYVNSTGVDGANNVHEYVEGYANVDHSLSSHSGQIFKIVGNITYVVVELKSATLSEGYGTSTHPIRKSALMYLRFAESQLLGMSFDFNSGGMSLQSVGNMLVAPFMSIAQLFTGYYNMAAMRGYASQVGLNNRFPSFAKINVPTGVKYAGGHRVSKIVFDDQWSNLSRNSSTQGLSSTSYTKEYIYRNYDKSSTGVAIYEPMVASEENPLKKPIYYGADKVFFREMNLFVETPTGNSFYPGASVGYSKVIIKNKSHDNVSIGAGGITEKEFYTAKDFPVLNDRTPLKGAHYAPPAIPIPFIGSISRKHFGFSQGVYVELNDMHGKLKSESIKGYVDIRKDHEHGTTGEITGYYNALTELENKAITSGVKYNYHTKKGLELKSMVNVLDQGHEVEVEMGKTVEFYAASRQNTNSVSGVDYMFNATVSFPPPALVPMAQMRVSDSYQTYREYTTTKLISRKGIIKSVEVYDGLSTAITENLVYDGETGEVILSRTNNEFDDPVYSYNIKGHNHYKGMQGAYKNLDYVISGTDYYAGISVRDYPFEVGDMLDIYKSPKVTDAKYWVKEVNYGTTYPTTVAQTITVIDASGVTSPLNSVFQAAEECRIIKSGNKNLLGQSSASITSLSNPLTDAQFPLDLTGVPIPNNGYLLNGYVEKISDESGMITAEYCADGQNYGMNAWVIPKSEPNVLQMYHLVNNTPEVLLTVIFDKSIFGLGSTSGAAASAFGGTFTRDGRYLKLIHSGTTYLGVVDPSRSKLSECLDGVLNAQATQFRDHLSDQTSIVNDQVINDVLAPYFSGSNLTSIQNKMNSNPYRYGTRGIYRAEKSSLYRIIREQETGSAGNLNHTDIREDGVYDVFNFYSPVKSAVNTNWYEKATAVRYSPYSGEVESKNPLGIYSAAIFGYRNQLPITIGQNTKYFELAYTGLEEESTGAISNSTVFKGHIGNVVGGSGASIVNTQAHTGSKSIQLTTGNFLSIEFSNGMKDLDATKEYIIELWVKKGDGANNATPTISVPNSSVSVFYDNNKTNIEGWQLISMKFTPILLSDYVKILNPSSANIYIDDIRISPANSAVKSYVYDRSFYRVIAELDSRHYATFYDYDEAGNLVQIKKETERGIMTVQTQRKSTNNH